MPVNYPDGSTAEEREILMMEFREEMRTDAIECFWDPPLRQEEYDIREEEE